MSETELIVINASIVTMDPLTPRVTALAVVGGRVCALGSDAEIRKLAASNTRIVDAGGRLVLPGFQDTHIHLQDSGYGYGRNANLDAAENAGQLQEILRKFAVGHKGGWVKGVGWYSGIFTSHNLNRAVLDVAVPDRPCFILASDGHNATINSRACEVLGVDRSIQDPPNGHFVRDKNGEPTGMLYESAIAWVEERLPEPSDEDYKEGVRFAQKLCNRHGITGVLDASINARHARIYSALEAQNELTVRICATARVESSEETVAAVERVKALRAAHQSGMFSVHSAKFFLDGVFENRTAVMLADYSDAKGGNAELMFEPGQVKEMFTAFDAARFQIHVHVIGDGAARAALDGLEAARDANGAWPSLHQLAHVQSIDPTDIPRFRELGVVANIQPLWARLEPSISESTLPLTGEERGKWIYAFRSLIDAGAPYVISSDWGVSTLNPFPIMQTAITRQPPGKGKQHPVFLPEQRMTINECVKGYTVLAAEAAWRSRDTGSLSPGKFADIIILDRDIFACDPYEIAETKVLLTLLGGKPVHSDDIFATNKQ
jgi:predicted amidohydrolase YtcJ